MSGCCFEADGGVSPGGGGGGGGAFLTKIDASSLTNVEIDLQFEDDLTDSSANGLDLSNSGVDPDLYMTHRTGLRGVWGRGDRFWERAANDAALTIVGELTIHILCVLSNVNSGKLFVFAPSGGGGETEADNWLYSLQIVSGAGATPLIRYFAETGGGANIQEDFDLITPEDIGLLTFTRQDEGGGTDAIRLFWNGAQMGNTITGVTRPSGGTNSRLALCDVSGGVAWVCWYHQFLIQSEFTAAADVLAVAQQVGVAPA